MNIKKIALGSLNKKPVYYDMEEQKFYTFYVSEDNPSSESKMIFSVLIAIPILYSLNYRFIIEPIYAICLLVFGGVGVYCLGKCLQKQALTNIEKQAFQLLMITERELPLFLQKELKNIRMAYVLVYFIVPVILMLDITFIYSGKLLFFIVHMGLSLPFLLFWITQIPKRKLVLQTLLDRYFKSKF